MKYSLIRLLKNAERRLWLCTLTLAMIFALFTVLGREIQQYGAFREWNSGLFFSGAGCFIGLTIIYAIAAAAIFLFFDWQSGKPAVSENLFGRITGSGLFVFVLLLVGWIPVWLAFWPGHFSADSLTQFYSYYNEEPYAHHPLVHTALLGVCMMLGIDMHPEGYATYGLAIYCGVQMILLAGCIAYGVWWLKRRGVPVWARMIVTLLFAFGPFYAPWPFCAQKDVLFAALAAVFCLQLTDLWRFGMKPLRMAAFTVIAVLMMLFRNNGVYALVLLIPFAVWWTRKGKRWQTGLLLTACAAIYLLTNHTMISVMEAEKGSKVEILSIPLQQIARTLRDRPEEIAADEEAVIAAIYGDTNPAEVYYPQIADPVKWAVDYDSLDENIPGLLKLWAQLGLRNPGTYLEAFLAQNLPYIMPYSQMLYNFDMTVHQIDWFPIEQHSYLPELRAVYEQYDQTLSFMGIPGTRLLSDTAFFAWLCLAGFVYALYRRENGYMSAFAFLLALWLTCLLGPVAIMRYMLGAFYAVPLLLAGLLARKKPS